MDIGVKLRRFYLLLLLYILSGIYILSVVITTPFIDIQLKQSNSQWTIEEFTYSNWANKYNVSKGDIILGIDDKSVQRYSQLLYDPQIRGAESILIQSLDGDIRKIPILYNDLNEQWFMHFVFPLIYFILSVLTILFLYIKKQDIPSIKLLIVFNAVVALAYISSGASARLNLIGLFINSSFLLLSLVLLIQFFKNSFLIWGIENRLLLNIKILYIIPILAIVVRLVRIIYPPFTNIDTQIVQILFLFLVIYAIYILITSYLHYNLLQLKTLFLGLVAPFIPFFLLFLLPELIFRQPILNAEICSLFLLLIPFNVIFFHLTERLFDIQYYVTRLRYYIIIACIFSSCITLGLNLFIEISLHELTLYTIYITFCTVILFYIKERIDYKGRKVLFSTKGNYMHQLYQIIQKLGTTFKVDEILNVLSIEISKHLEIKNVYVVIYDFESKQYTLNDHLLNDLDDSTIISLPTGYIIKSKYYYIATIHEDSNYKRWIFINHNKNIRLKHEELIWLELILTYSSVFIENTKVIEDLIEELQSLKKERIGEPSWMKKLLWFKTENEKFKLAQDLHDTILQENIAIARRLDHLISEIKHLEFYPQFNDLHQQVLHSVQQLRTYCETLKPTLLYQMGMHVALERLVEKIESQVNFTIEATFDRLYLENEQVTLAIYRIVQELLNNAIKHSQANYVYIAVFETIKGIEISYEDDGIGCEVDELEHSESLGLYGIKERVSVFNGEILIQSKPNEGFMMQILIYERENVNDFIINS